MNRPEFENDEVKQLLPWYVNGTLDAEERVAVVQHLDDCSECCDAVAELRRISSAIENGQPTPLVPEPPVGDFLDIAFAQKRRLPESRRAQWFAAAASVLGFIAVTYWLTMSLPDANIFRTVTEMPSAADITYVFAVDIADGSYESVRRAVSQTIVGGSIVEFESGYRVAVSMPSATIKELEVFSDSLRQIDGVQRVDIVGVQLPLE